MSHDDAEFDGVHPRLLVGTAARTSGTAFEAPDVPEQDLNPRESLGATSGAFNISGTAGLPGLGSRSSSETEFSVRPVEEDYVAPKGIPTHKKPAPGRILPQHSPPRGAGHVKAMAERPQSASGLLNSDMPHHCMNLGVIMELLQHLLLAHEVKFTVQLLESLCSSKLSSVRLPMTNEDLATELQKFVNKQKAISDSDSALGLIEMLIFAKRNHRHQQRGSAGASSQPWSETSIIAGPKEPKPRLFRECSDGADSNSSVGSGIKGGMNVTKTRSGPHYRPSHAMKMSKTRSGPALRCQRASNPNLGNHFEQHLGLLQMDRVQSLKRISENREQSKEASVEAHHAVAKRHSHIDVCQTQDDKQEADVLPDAEETPVFGAMLGTVHPDAQHPSAQAGKPSAHFTSTVEAGSTTPDSNHEDDEEDGDGEDTFSERASQAGFPSNGSRMQPLQRKRTTFLLSEETPVEDWVDDCEDLDALTIGQMNWLGRPSDRFVLHPTATFRMAWDVLALFFIIFECVTLPLAISFGLALPEVVKSSSTCFFVLDMALNFNTGYFEGCLLIMRRRRFVTKYLKTWFLLDMAATVPWEFIANLIEKNPTSATAGGSEAVFLRIVKLGKLMRGLRLLRLAKLGALFVRLQSAGVLNADNYEHKLPMTVGKMFMVFGIMSHWTACIWGWIGDAENMGVTVLDPYEIARCTMGGPCEPGIEGSPWRRRYGMDNYSSFTQYVAALQYTTALMTGGEVSMAPGSGVERLYTVIMMIVSVFLTSAVVGEILLIMNRHNEKNISFDEMMSHARVFMVSREVPFSLQVRIYRYLQAQHTSALKQQGSRDFMENLSKWLHAQLVECLHHTHICRHPFFKELSMTEANDEALTRLCLEAKPVVFAAGDPVVEEGHLALGAHFLVCGKLNIDKGSFGRPLYVKPPCWIGDTCLFVETLRACSVYAVSTSETIFVSKASVQSMLLEFPALQDLHDKYKQQILDGDLSSLKCTLCGDMGHLEDTCPENVEHNKKAVRKKSSVSVTRRSSVVFQYFSGLAEGMKSRASRVATCEASEPKTP